MYDSDHNSECLDPRFGYSRNIAGLFRPELSNIVCVGGKEHGTTE
jgi:hypothetical protein